MSQHCLANPESGLVIELQENQAIIISVENPSVLRDLIESLRQALLYGEETWSLSDDLRWNLSKNAELILSPWDIDLNNPRIKKKLFAYLHELTNETCHEDLMQLNSDIMRYIERVADTSDCALSYADLFTDIDLFKFADVKLDIEEGGLLDRLVTYIKTVGALCDVRLVVFLHLHDYFTEDELAMLYQEMYYRKIYPILLETSNVHCITSEKHIIIDKDRCVISC